MHDAAERTMMPGLVPLDVDQALRLKLRMFHLRRAECPMTLAQRGFIANVCHRDPAELTAEQRAHVDRLAWRFGYTLPAALRLKEAPADVTTQAA